MNDKKGMLRGTSLRLFLTCWLVFVLHFATDFVREHYLVLSIADDFSFRLDKYVGLHWDIFMTPDHGAHHGANPGASMIAAVPYLVFKPLVDRIVDLANARRAGQPPQGQTAVYNDDRAPRVEFYKKVRERGLDIKFGLVGFITMAFCMAPLSAFSAVLMFRVLGLLGLSGGLSLAMSLLYALGTPVFFRTGYLNQNLMVGIFAFLAFVLLWKPDVAPRWVGRRRIAAAGFLCGLAVLCDYSGLVPLIMLGGYLMFRRRSPFSLRDAVRDGLWYGLGAIGPILLLMFYQWSSFGSPFFPGQHYMPQYQVMGGGYQGFAWPNRELLGMLLFDRRFGLFVCAPILILALAAPILGWLKKSLLPMREILFLGLLSAGFLLFFGGLEYTKLQWVTGIRYLVPVIPFLFLLAVEVLLKMPRIVVYGLAAAAIIESWCLAMVRPVGIPEEGVLDAVKRVFLEGFQLPWLTTLSKMATQYVPFLEGRTIASAPFFALTAVVLYGIWRVRPPWKSLRSDHAE
jgi:hypothetical protein